MNIGKALKDPWVWSILLSIFQVHNTAHTVCCHFLLYLVIRWNLNIWLLVNISSLIFCTLYNMLLLNLNELDSTTLRCHFLSLLELWGEHSLTTSNPFINLVWLFQEGSWRDQKGTYSFTTGLNCFWPCVTLILL